MRENATELFWGMIPVNFQGCNIWTWTYSKPVKSSRIECLTFCRSLINSTIPGTFQVYSRWSSERIFLVYPQTYQCNSTHQCSLSSPCLRHISRCLGCTGRRYTWTDGLRIQILQRQTDGRFCLESTGFISYHSTNFFSFFCEISNSRSYHTPPHRSYLRNHHRRHISTKPECSFLAYTGIRCFHTLAFLHQTGMLLVIPNHIHMQQASRGTNRMTNDVQR